MAKVKWIHDTFASLGKDTVRVELGPQIIEMDCNAYNLLNSVTSAHYHLGAIDALGVEIGTAKKMHCVDWRARHVCLMWKVYKLKEVEDITIFVKIKEFENKHKAIKFAGGLV